MDPRFLQVDLLLRNLDVRHSCLLLLLLHAGAGLWYGFGRRCDVALRHVRMA